MCITNVIKKSVKLHLFTRTCMLVKELDVKFLMFSHQFLQQRKFTVYYAFMPLLEN
jgi:hypothetical protein